MAPTAQTYQNHGRLFPPFHLFVVPVLLLNFIYSIVGAVRAPSFGTGWAVVVAAALVMLALTARVMALTVQDRVIRLEMRLRLQQCLPADLRTRINDLTPRQLVALRFASDAEIADLVRDVLAGKLTRSKEIKLRVKDWQADFLRA